MRRKTARAASAFLPPYRTLLDRSRAFADLIPIGNAFTRHVFDGPFYLSASPRPDLPSVSLVFVQSKDGNTGAASPSTLGGGDVDLHVIYEGLSRVAADAVLAGALTAGGPRTVLSVWHPELVTLRSSLGLPRHPAHIVITDMRFDLDRARFANVPELRVFVVTTPSGRERMNAALERRPWITPIVMPATDGLAHALRVLARDHAIRRISCIGGATTASGLIDAHLVQDLYLTTAPRPGGEPGTPSYQGSSPPQYELVLRKEGTGPERGVTFEHWRVLPAR